MDFGLLGTVQAGDDAGLPCPVPQGRLRNLLAALLVHADTVVSIEALVSCVWDERQVPRQPREALQVMVVRLRKCLGPEVGARITSVRPGYRLRVQPDELDLHRFEQLLHRGSAALATQDWTTARDLLGRALACWRGDALADVRPGTALDRTLDSLNALRLRAQRQLVEARLRLGDHAELVDEIAGLVERHPFDEQLRAQLMLALHGCGRRAEALDAFQSARRTFAEELGIEPGADLCELHQALLAGGLHLPERGQSAAHTTAPPPSDAAGRHPRPAQLPAGLPDFTGRSQAAEQLEVQLAKVTGIWARGPLVLSAIDGAGGIGKTTLAVHVAHRVAGLFPDGQLHADLHGAGGRPAEPGEVLARFLRGLGTPSELVPVDLEERAALYRTVLATRRVLVLLDNVRDAAQVRPLLPGTATCAVLITSRSTLPGLDGAFRLTLDFLGPEEALELFTHIVGREVVAAEPDAVKDVLRVCSGLPLAIRIAAGRLGARPGGSVRELAGRLADERLRLDELAVEDRAIRATFAVSYHDLAEDQARAFRLLSVDAAPSITAPAAAALLGVTVDEARRILDALLGVHLLQSPERDRYRFHDLLRLFAAECAQADASPAERDAALHRLLRWYLHRSAAASRSLNPVRRHVTLDAPAPEWEPLDFEDSDEALGWLESERPNLVAAVAQATQTGRHEIGWKLPIVLWDLFSMRSWQDDGVECNENALVNAEKLEDREATAWVLNSLSSAYQGVGRLTDALDCLSRALEIRRDIGDLRGEGSCLINLGYVYIEMGRPTEAVALLERAAVIFEDMGLTPAVGAVLTNLAFAHQKRGDDRTALRYHERALAIHQDTPNEYSIARELANMAGALFRLGRLDEAAETAARGVETNRVTGNQADEGFALDVLGQVHAARGHHSLARRHWQDAYAVLDAVGHPHAAEIRARLAVAP